MFWLCHILVSCSNCTHSVPTLCVALISFSWLLILSNILLIYASKFHLVPSYQRVSRMIFWFSMSDCGEGSMISDMIWLHGLWERPVQALSVQVPAPIDRILQIFDVFVHLLQWYFLCILIIIFLISFLIK